MPPHLNHPTSTTSIKENLLRNFTLTQIKFRMKFATLVAIFASSVLAKNVVNFDDLVDVSKKGLNEKRDPKNIVPLDVDSPMVHDTGSVDTQKQKLNFHDARHFGNGKRSVPQRPILPVPLLQSVLPQVSEVSIFSRYLRDDDALLLHLGNPEGFTLILAPSDNAITSFSTQVGLKPWEFPEPVKNDATDDAVIGRNIDSFVKAHMSLGDPSIKADNTLSGVLLNDKPFKIVKLVDDTYTLEVDSKKIAVSSVHLAGNGIVFVVENVLADGQRN